MNTGNLKDLERRIKRLERGSPLASASVGRGRVRFYDGSVLLIENGALQVTGTATITGTLESNGVLNANGVNNLRGENHLTGPTDVAGNFEIIAGGQFKAGDSLIYPDGSAKFGALGIASDGRMTAGLFELRPDGSADFGTLGIAADGTLTVRNDVNVITGGKIKAGNVEIDPTDGGTIRTLNATISDNGATLQILSPAGLQLNGISTNIASPDIFMPSLSTKLGAEPNLHIDENKKIWICG
ncbi:hypothetical protein AAZQ98_06970 [Glutamicibacter sp. Je.9.36]